MQTSAVGVSLQISSKTKSDNMAFGNKNLIYQLQQLRKLYKNLLRSGKYDEAGSVSKKIDEIVKKI